MAEKRGAKVLCLGALNKAEWMNNGALAHVVPGLAFEPLHIDPILYRLHPSSNCPAQSST